MGIVSHWIAKAHIKKGALHQELGIPEGQKIPPATIAAAAQKPGIEGKRARLAQTFAKMRG